MTSLATLALLLAQPPADFSKPGPMHKLLGQMIGTWKVDVEYKIGDMPAQKSSATCKAEWVMKDLFVRKHYSSQMMGQPFLVEQTIGYDVLRKEFFEWQIESNNTGRLQTRGELGKDGKSIVCTGPSMDPMTMKPATLRTVTIFNSPDEYTIEWWMKVGDKPEAKQVTLLHTRIKL